MLNKNAIILILTISIAILFVGCETMDKLMAGEPLASGNIMAKENTRENAQVPEQGEFIPDWVQGKWAKAENPEELYFDITPNEILRGGKLKVLSFFKSKLWEEQGYTMEFFVKTNEPEMYELDAGANDDYTLYFTAKKEADGLFLTLAGVEEGTLFVPYTGE